MPLDYLQKGILIGFSIAAPVGPIGVLCIRRCLNHGLGTSFVTGLGAATADAAYGCVAGFGLTAISTFLIQRQFWLGLVGGTFLCYLGIRTFLSPPAQQPAASGPAGLWSAYVSTVLLTLANPTTILSFAAVFAGLGLGLARSTETQYSAAGALVTGVFLGSASWWLLLSLAVGSLRSHVDSAWMRAVNRLSGSVILAFGIYALSRLRSG